MSREENFDMTAPATGRRRGKPVAHWNGTAFEVRKGTKLIVISAATQGEEPHLLVELDAVTHWNDSANAEPHESDELSIQDLHAVLEAIEAEADEQGLSLEFE